MTRIIRAYASHSSEMAPTVSEAEREALVREAEEYERRRDAEREAMVEAYLQSMREARR